MLISGPDAFVELLWRASWQAVLLMAIVLVVVLTLRRWIAPRWRVMLWTVPLCRLLILVTPASFFSLFNAFAVRVPEPPVLVAESASASTSLPALPKPVVTAGESLHVEPNERLEHSMLAGDQNKVLENNWGNTSLAGLERRSSFPVSIVLIGVWILGFLASILYWGMSQFALTRVLANGRLVDDGPLNELISSRCKARGLRRKVQCKIVADDIGPSVCGIFRPTILLSQRLFDELNEEQLRAVVFHEIEHICRWDGLYLLVSRFAVAIHWFNPFAHFVCRRIRHEVELAVDASTVSVLGEHLRLSYGELLILLARRPVGVVGVTHMADNRSGLQSRIRELAVPASTDKYRSALAFTGVAALALCGLTDVAAVQDQAPEKQQTQRPVEATVGVNEAAREPGKGIDTQARRLDERIANIQKTANWGFVTRDFIRKIESRQADLKGTPVTVSGVVRDESQQPVADAFVVLRLMSGSTVVHNLVSGSAQDVFAVAWTDADGRFRFNQQPTPWFEPANPLTWELCVFASGYAVDVKTYASIDDSDRFEEIELLPESIVEGTIKDAEGNKVTHVGFAHVETVSPYDAALDQSLLFSEMLHYVRPDEDGRIRIGGLPSQRIVNIIPQPGVDYSVTHIATTPDIDPERVIAKGRPRSFMVHPHILSPFEVAVTPKAVQHASSGSAPPATRTISVRVVDAVTGRGVSNVGVGWGLHVDSLAIRAGMEVTDSDGNALLAVPQKNVDVFVGGRRFGYKTHYNRITANPNEFTPAVERSYWVRTVDPEEDRVTFELQPVPPLAISVRDEDGSPVVGAELTISQTWSSYRMPPVFTNSRGDASVPVRPVMFDDVKIVATTATGSQGSEVVELSKDLTEMESVVIVVK